MERLKRKREMDERLILTTVTEGDLQRPDFFRMIGCKVHLGRPKKTATTFTHIVIFDLPRERTSFEVLNLLQKIGVGIISSHPIPGAIPLTSLAQAEAQDSAIIVRPEDNWEALLALNPSVVIFKPKALEAIAPFLDWFRSSGISTPLILNVPDELDSHQNLGIWIDAPLALDLRREMSFHLLKTS